MFFRGRFKDFSNFSGGFIDEYGLHWKTAEHFYQAHKTTNQYWHMYIFESPTGRDAKHRGNELRKAAGCQSEDWNKIRNAIMLKALILKFQQNPRAMKLLLQTTEFIEETNNWHDNYWGNCICEKCKNLPGKNMLGKFLMRLRKKFLLQINNAYTIGRNSTNAIVRR